MKRAATPPASVSAAAVQPRATPLAHRPEPVHPPLPQPLARVVGILAVVASAMYFASDAIEAAQGGFSTLQLWLTLVAEAAIPVFVIGLVLVLGPGLGPVGRIAAGAYAYAFTVFTGTVVYALMNGTEDYDALTEDLGPLMTVHGIVMVVAGIGLGAAVIRRRALPVWAGICLIVGVILVAATQGMPVGAELIASGTRDLAFAAFGVALLPRRAEAVTSAAWQCHRTRGRTTSRSQPDRR